MPSSAIDAVLFDLDGTLAESDQDPDTVLETAFSAVGVTRFCDPDQIRAAAADVDVADDDVDFFRQTFRRAAARHDGPVAAAGDLASAYDAAIDRSAVSFRPGAATALSVARDRGPVGLITNGSRESQLIKLRSLGIDDAFDTRVFAGDGTQSKPAPEPFETAVTDLGIEPHAGYFVGNSLEDDVVGAKNLGLRAGWFPQAGDDREDPSVEGHRPDHTFESLHELVTLIEDAP